MNMKRLVGALVAVFLVGTTSLLLDRARRTPLKISGLIEADEIRVGSRVGGRVRQVLALEGQRVNAGQVLVALEPFDWQEKLVEARSLMAARQNEYERVKAGFRAEERALAKAKFAEAEAAFAESKEGPRKQEKQVAADEVKLAEAQLLLAQQMFDRAKRLLPSKAVSAEEYERSTTELKVAQQQLAVAKSRSDMIHEGTRAEQLAQVKARLDGARADLALRERGYRDEEVNAAKANLEAAQAALRALERQVAELEIRAPIESTVEAADLQPGALLAANAPALTLLDSRRLRIRAYLPELYLGAIKEGDERPVTVDGFADRTFKGRVSFIAREAEFTPTNIQTADGRSKQVFRVKVDLIEGLDVLRAGMAADVYLEIPR